MNKIKGEILLAKKFNLMMVHYYNKKGAVPNLWKRNSFMS